MASNRDRKPPISNFFSFMNKPLPTVVAPQSTMALETSDNFDGWNMPPEEAENEFAYVKEHAQKRQDLINRAHSRFAGQRNENVAHRPPANDERNGRGRGQRRGGERGRGRGGGGARGNRVAPGKSIFGTMPEQRASDLDVYAKYDFDSRKFDTSGLAINIEQIRNKIISHLVENQIMIIEGFTGCGKTTQVPQFILDDAVDRQQSCRVVVTQPRRIAAISVANRVGAERGWKVGGLVGYQVGMDKRVSEDTRVTYMTTGVLLQLLIAKKSLNEWTHIIIDEVHERDLDTDLLLLVINKLMVQTGNRSSKIILMSATLNKDKFAKYFPLWDDSKNEACVCIQVDSPNQFPIIEYYLEDVARLGGYQNLNMDGLEEPKVHQECYEIAEKIIEGLDAAENKDTVASGARNVIRGAVLVFLPGLLEIEMFYKILTEVSSIRASSEGPNRLTQWQVLPLHSSITNEEQQRVFVHAKPGCRKIILATNIAESSITVPDIKYVIDFCLTKSLSCDSTTNYTCLRLEWASKNQCIQRRGRCGRVSSGLVYRMITRKFYETLEQECQPEMLKSSLESVVLQVKLLDMGTPADVLSWAVDPPRSVLILRAVANLKEIGALTICKTGGAYDAYDGDLTFVGRVLSRLPIDIRLGRLILLGHAFDCLEETVIIAAGLSVKTPFAYPYSKRLDAYLSKLSWTAQSFSDCVALLNLYTGWYQRHQNKEFLGFQDEKAWARQYFVQLTSLREMKVLIDEIYKRLRMCGIELLPTARGGEDQSLVLKLVIAGGFYPNYFNRTRPNPKDYHKEINKDVAGRDPFLSVVFQGFPLEQPGDLYKKTIARHVAFQNSIPNIQFHGSKVVVSFDSRGDKLGPISSAVYRAVKLRQLRQTITFATPSRDEAYGLINTGKMKLEMDDVLASPRQIVMPGLKVRTFQAIVTHIESPGEFFIMKKSDELVARQIVDALNKVGPSLDTIPRELCFPGQLCIVRLKQKCFRARIDSEKHNREELLVYLIDRGMSMWIRRQMIYRVDRKACELGLDLKPALAIKCRLSGLRAAMRSGCVWTTEALRLFEKYCVKTNNQVYIEIYSVVECVIAGVLKNSEVTTEPSANDLLIEKKFAEKCTEPADSRENRNNRDRVLSDVRGEVVIAFKALEDQQNICVIPERLMDPPHFEKEPEQLAVLRGPHSPLEMVFSSLCRSAHLKQVITDGSSTNSVVLDQDPSNPSSRLLIAANVAIAARSGNILARETTIMPPIPGLCGLLAMLFCPKMEIRVDSDYTMYTGCVTGLGIDPQNGLSIYRDHDMEVVFDTVIDNRDIALVNSIRNSMNYVLQEEAQNTNVQNLRIRMRREAIQLLECQRDSMEEVWPEQPHEWNMIHADRLRFASKSKEGETVVFPLHPYVALDDKQDGIDVPINRNMFSCDDFVD